MPTVRRADVPPDVWAQLTGADPAAKRKRLLPPELVEPAFAAPGTLWVAAVTCSESNAREWRGRSARTQAARRAVSRACGPHLRALAAFAEAYHAGGALRVALTRLGGKRLDAGNVAVALKAVEDALCLILGADDGDPRWCATYHQESGGCVGVRVELEACGEGSK